MKQDFKNIKPNEFDELEQFILHKLYLMGLSVEENLSNYNS